MTTKDEITIISQHLFQLILGRGSPCNKKAGNFGKPAHSAFGIKF
jgi:hypothetical protein